MLQVDNRMRAWYQKDMSTGLLYICSLGRQSMCLLQIFAFTAWPEAVVSALVSPTAASRLSCKQN